ncbi:YgcG family protein [Proteiniphilum sp. X52]|uniref:TPM domain-containing protein n=1 Tax=Proteiniphilum sp. X52 TaxID=2382159 RepID=UPI000F0A51BF|nr:TPM domain-containing protein [Proteiniphilum sp. X52]RNC66909.1 TPM domain-containing protein [Proteiniphilum sp. X52]
MKLLWKSKYLLILIFFSSLGLSAQDIPSPMVPYRLVNDFAAIFSPAEEQALEQKLRAYHDSTSTQIYVVSVSDLGGYPASDYAFRLGEKWEIGQKSKDNGAVILIKPKIGNSRGQAFIATGYGLEARINDAYAGRVVRDEMIPYFIDEDYFGGVNAAIDVMIARLSGEFVADAKEEEGIPFFVIIIILVGIILLLSFLSKGGDQHISGGGHRTSPPLFFPPISGGHRSGGFGSGSGWSGGFGGGGFGGGGGGRFGGGGAGGSW